MPITLKKGDKLEDILKKIGSKKEEKGLDAKRFVGVIKRIEDPVEYQKNARNEWE